MKSFFSLIPVVAVFALAACGGNGAGAFEGTWSYQNAVTTISCPGYAPSTSTTKGNDTWVAGSTSDLVLTDPSGCDTTFDVANGTATALPGQTCSQTGTADDGTAVTETIAPTTFTVSLSSDQRAYTVNESGSLTLTAGGSSLVCTYTYSESATRVGK